MTLDEALKQAEDAIELYETHESPFADDWATTAHCLKRALEDLREAIEDEPRYAGYKPRKDPDETDDEFAARSVGVDDQTATLRQAYLEGKSDRRWEEKQGTFAPNPYPYEGPEDVFIEMAARQAEQDSEN